MEAKYKDGAFRYGTIFFVLALLRALTPSVVPTFGRKRVVAGQLPISKLFLFKRLKHIFINHFIVTENMSFRS